MIFKRKSFRKFNDNLKLTNDELLDIDKKIKDVAPLVDNIDVKYRIVRSEETTCKRGAYCLLIYSEEKEGFLLKYAPSACITNNVIFRKYVIIREVINYQLQDKVQFVEGSMETTK
jgi:hypothetical protein